MSSGRQLVDCASLSWEGVRQSAGRVVEFSGMRLMVGRGAFGSQSSAVRARLAALRALMAFLRSSLESGFGGVGEVMASPSAPFWGARGGGVVGVAVVVGLDFVREVGISCSFFVGER